MSSPSRLGSFASFSTIAVAALSSLAACGSGPTDAPKLPDQTIAVGGVRGDAGLTTAQTTPASESTGRSRPRSAIAEPSSRPAPPDDDPNAAPLADPGPDPMRGSFTLAQAVVGLPATGPLVATIKTSKGELRCKLFDEKAPIAVANFVGLARGARPFKDKGQWVTRAAYDGTTFHRVIKGFMVQGGDPQGTGRGEPGYVFKDELWAGNGSKHDRPGLLCMANRGPDTNGMQFFITDASAPHLDRSYTIFGECAPVSVVHAIANVPTDPGDRPQQDITIDKVEISRGGVTAPVGGGAKDGGAPPPPPAGASSTATPPATPALKP
jgi:peptidyl-prolyl cis-trans isomerase A (cyclophilin A)